MVFIFLCDSKCSYIFLPLSLPISVLDSTLFPFLSPFLYCFFPSLFPPPPYLNLPPYHTLCLRSALPHYATTLNLFPLIIWLLSIIMLLYEKHYIVFHVYNLFYSTGITSWFPCHYPCLIIPK